MGLLDFLKRKPETPAPAEKSGGEDGLEVYSGMRVEVTAFDGRLLFVAKLMGLQGSTAKLYQYSDTEEAPEVPQEDDEAPEPLRVRIRGYHDRERKAVYMEGSITPQPKHVWQVTDLHVARIGNDRAFFRLSMDVEAAAIKMGGIGAGEKPCRLVNISVGGACISSEYAYHEGDKFLLKVKLLEDREPSVMFCQVLRIIDKGEGRTEYGCRFLELNETDQARITQNIFAVQRKKRGAS